MHRTQPESLGIANVPPVIDMVFGPSTKSPLDIVELATTYFIVCRFSDKMDMKPFCFNVCPKSQGTV